MIQSFGDSLTEKIFNGVKDKETARFPQDLLSVARRKLDMIEFSEFKLLIIIRRVI
jgi:toxin HigB-1